MDTNKKNPLDITGMTNEQRAALGQGYSDVPGSFNTATGQPNTQQGAVIPFDSLTQKAPTIPQAPQPVDSSGAFVDSMVAQNQNAITKKLEADKLAKEQSTLGVSKLMKDIGLVEARQGLYEQEAGAGRLQEQVDDLQSQIELEGRALKGTIDELYRNPNLSVGLMSRRANEAQRKSASFIADLAITQQVLSRKYDRAIDTAKRKVEMETAPLRADLDSKKFYFESMKDSWSNSEKADLTRALNAEERVLETQQKDMEKAEEMKINLLRNNAPASIKSKIQGLKTVADILKIPGIEQYLRSPEEKLELALKSAQLNKIRTETSLLGVDGTTTEGGFAQTPEGSLNQLNMLEGVADKAASLYKGSGRTGLHELVGGIFTLTEKEQLKGLSNTLKTNVLTMATDPNIKKFFGPQMTENDVTMMTSAGTTLNPELQTRDDYKEEVMRIRDMFTRAKQAVEKGIMEETTGAYLDASATALQKTDNPFIK